MRMYLTQHTGYYTILLARLCARTLVIALEASSVNYFYMRWNLVLNRGPSST